MGETECTYDGRVVFELVGKGGTDAENALRTVDSSNSIFATENSHYPSTTLHISSLFTKKTINFITSRNDK